MPSAPFARPSTEFAMRALARFFREHGGAFAQISALLLLPCFWHAHIQAGDLGSHVYNAWLAQLIERHQVSGLAIAGQWNNILFDLMLLRAGDLFGFLIAEKICVSVAVLVFFWGSFSFLAAISDRLPWSVSPLLGVLTYGYVFHMGFMNFYLSLGLAFFALSLVWRGGEGNWIVAPAVAAFALLAHPIGFLLIAVLSVYLVSSRALKGWSKLLLPVPPLIAMPVLRIYLQRHEEFQADWGAANIFRLLGQDQLNVFGAPYRFLATAMILWAAVCFLAVIYDWIFRAQVPARSLRLAVELFLLAAYATVFIPENFRVSLYAGWIGLLVSRLTLVTAILLLLVLSSVRLPRSAVYGFSVIAILFFGFLYRDTGKLNRLEASARAAIQALAPGTRVAAVANAPSDWRSIFIHHSAERACIGRCFSFANYEPSSLQFRVRALPGNYYVTDSADTAESMSSGDYVVQSSDLPLTSLYQCDDSDFTRICALPLKAGQKTEDPESAPAAADPPPLPSK
jgi:hypothetical protein